MDGQNLGRMLAEHPVNNARRGTTALIGLLLGVPAAVLGVLMMIGEDARGGPGAVPAVVIGIGLGGVLIAGWQGWLYLTRTGEVFRLHVDGIEHAYSGSRRAVPWGDIVTVSREGKDTALARALGGDTVCRIKTGDGAALTITGLTADARALIDAVWQAAPETARG